MIRNSAIERLRSCNPSYSHHTKGNIYTFISIEHNNYEEEYQTRKDFFFSFYMSVEKIR